MTKKQRHIFFWGWIVAVSGISTYAAVLLGQTGNGKPTFGSMAKMFLVVFLTINLVIPYVLVYCWPWRVVK